jgi:hypothetical protein
MPALATNSRPLSRLRADLNRLRQRRAVVRIGVAVANVLLIFAIAVVIAFLADYGLNLSPLQRGFVLAGILLAAVWASSRTLQSWLGVHEDATDLALLVERRHGLDRDLVAALQFQTTDAVSWGSPRLEEAVIDDADDRSRSIDPLAGFSWKPLPGRALLVAFSVAAIAMAAASFPAHTSAFLRRLALADVPYPTRTRIESLSINGRDVDLRDSAPLRAPAGRPLVFNATWSGETPRVGSVQLVGDSGATTEIKLQASNDPRAYAGSLESISEPVTFTLHLGDDETRPRRIETVPLPIVSLDIVPTPPAYARSNAPAAPPAGARTAFALQGSSIALRVRSENKPLQRVEVAITADGKADTISIPLKASEDRKTWTLPPSADSHFADVRAPVSFTVKVVDDDGLSPVEPLSGAIRLRQDRAPRVIASAVVRRVLPTGRPHVAYRASDDFGIKELNAKLIVQHQDGTEQEHVVPLPFADSGKLEAEGRHALDLSAFQLAKGDKVTVTVTAEDVRGQEQGEIASSEPIVLEVTDREGLLAELLESDEEGADRLDAIIRRELGIGAQR